jgi:hypothetical protein
VWSKYVSKKPTNWKDIETSMFHRKENREPVGRASMIISPIDSGENGAWTVVSQYGGTASACACA